MQFFILCRSKNRKLCRSYFEKKSNTGGPRISWFQNSWSPLFRDLVSGTISWKSPLFRDFKSKKKNWKFYKNEIFANFSFVAFSILPSHSKFFFIHHDRKIPISFSIHILGALVPKIDVSGYCISSSITDINPK